MKEMTQLNRDLTSETKIEAKAEAAAKENKSCCLFIGGQGSGKSTLLAHLCGAELTFEKKGLQYHISHGNNSRFPEINHSKKHSPTAPKIHSSSNGTILYEPPTFLGSKSTHKEALTSSFAATMASADPRYKIVITIDTPTLMEARGKPLKEAAKRIHQLFPNDFRTTVESCLLVVTKVNIVYSLSDLYDHLSEISQEDHLEAEVADLLTTLLHKKRILLYPNPTKMSQAIKGIEGGISKLPEIMHCE